ncbi:hypothetical protein [Celeribacter baekdonensis]|uniref:Uncharacterized protein n=1 Tax=Celeribacter baekdonensis TaxID=875171 RepID=A0A2R4M0F5_9RHOB|nr:hypothetical protein [Celeribacter baekdonensis]AVW90646.1 hypothetical protein DA792_05715 [Celeribacter baekdonensis]
MGKHDSVLQALRFVLCEKVYPRRLDLMRNDTRAAEVVESYVSIISEFYAGAYFKNPAKRTPFERNAYNVFWKIRPLNGLSKDTLRKYIAELWAKGAFDQKILFK